MIKSIETFLGILSVIFADEEYVSYKTEWVMYKHN